MHPMMFDPRFTAVRLEEARTLQRTGKSVSKANREGKTERDGWQYSPYRAQCAYADARMYLGVNDADQFYA